MNRTTTNPPVCSRAILRCTHPNAKCIIARQLPKYLFNLHQTEPTGPGSETVVIAKIDTYSSVANRTYRAWVPKIGRKIGN